MNCILCAARDVETELDSGHVCPGCQERIGRNLSDILRYVDMAAEHVQPGRGSGNRSPGFESRVPVNVAACDPELADLTVIPGTTEPTTLLELLSLWERMIRESRGFADYDVASVLRRGLRLPVMPSDVDPDGRSAIDRWFQSNGVTRDVRLPSVGQAALVGVVSFLRSQVEWACEDATFPIEDFAGEVHAAWSTVRHWGSDGGDGGTIVFCPTLTEDGTACDHRLRVVILREIDGRDDHRRLVTCPSCKATRSPDQLLIASGADDAFVPANMLAERFKVPEGTIRTWAKDGRVKRDGRRYRFGDVRRLVIERMTRRAVGSG